jgi:hypothetical protein
METYTVIGYQHKVGTFNGINFDNMVFSVVSPADEKKGEVGQIASVLKVKTSLLTSVPVVGDEVSPVYDRFGHIVDLR